jgi:hypothetical protein
MSLLSKLQSTLKAHHFIALVGILVLAYAIYQYSGRKNTIASGFGNPRRGGAPQPMGSAMAGGGLAGAPGQGVAQPANPAGQNEDYAKVSGVNTTTYGLSAATGSAGMTDPADLLPNDVNSQWGNLSAGADFKQVNMLKAGFHYGINTVGSSLRNANLQERSEPPNPTTIVSPWLNTTIEPDLMRAPLEIGCGAQ